MECDKRQMMYIGKTAIMISPLATILIILFLSTVASADNSSTTVHVTYVSFVDPGLGFYKVLDETTHQPSNYVGHILTINQGDTVIWKNDADTPNTAITIVSEQNLFPDAILNTNTAVFPYVFDQGGSYTFHIGEHTPSTQIILVRATNTPTPIPTPVPTPVTTVVPTPVATVVPTNTPIHTPDATAIIPTQNTPSSAVKPSLIQIVSIIVVILSIYITYKTGKDKE